MTLNVEPMIDITNHPVFNYKALGDPGKYVYHYTSWERLLDIMQTGFRLGTLAAMNDPRESKDWILSSASQDPARPAAREDINEAVSAYKRRIRIGAFCLDRPSGDLDDQSRRGYARPRMWAQYGENHRGVCIVMDRQELDQAIRSSYPERAGSWVWDGKIKYVETMRDEPSRWFLHASEDDVESSVRDYFGSLRAQMFFVKHIDWRDECEYRWVYYDADESETGIGGFRSPFVDIKAGVVVALVLGADYADAHLPIARMFAEAHGLRGGVVRFQWDRLYVRLIPFAADGDRWIPVDNSVRSMNIRIGAPRPKCAP